MPHLVSAMLVVAGIIHVLPLIGVLGADPLHRLYGLRIEDPNLLVLMRHRAVLFGLLGGFLLYAACKRDAQIAALIAGLVSAGSFAWIAWSSGGADSMMSLAMFRVVAADWVAIGCLLVALIVRLSQVSLGSE